jgi:hypothetical protein
VGCSTWNIASWVEGNVVRWLGEVIRRFGTRWLFYRGVDVPRGTLGNNGFGELGADRNDLFELMRPPGLWELAGV